jgi:hypothetical protein
VFTRPAGQPLRPSHATYRFHRLCAGADLKTIQDQLGHASIVLTADTYTSVLPPAQHDAAAATAALVMDAGRRLRGDITRKNKCRRARANAHNRKRAAATKPQVNDALAPRETRATCHAKRATGEQPLSA